MVLQTVDKVLRMLQTHSHGNAFGLQGNATVQKHGIDVSRRMPRGENHRSLHLGAVGTGHSCATLAVGDKSGNTCSETNLSAAALYGAADGLDNTRQAVGAYVRMGVDKYFPLRAVGMENAQNLLYRSALVASGIEFAVAVGSGSTLSEAVVGIGVDSAGAVHSHKVGSPAVDVLSPLQHDRPYAAFNKFQSREKACRTGAHDYSRRRIGDIGPLRRSVFGIGRDIDGIDVRSHFQIHHHTALAGVDGAAENIGTHHPCGGYMEGGGGSGGHRCRGGGITGGKP